MRRAILVLVWLGAACSAPDVIYVGSPHLRYDHNRQAVPIEWVCEVEDFDTGEVTEVELPIWASPGEVYRPVGDPAYPHLVEAAADGLRGAFLVPVFCGVELPLSSERRGDWPSDWEDLVDYLSEGPLAQAGVEPGDMAGDLLATAERYEEVLALLSSREDLSSRKALLGWAAEHDARHSFAVRDSRYRLRAFADVLALEVGDYWFVLYLLPGNDWFSRLVVVPAPFAGQKFAEKVPGSGDGS